METKKKKVSVLKVILSLVFAVAILGGFGYILLKGDVTVDKYSYIIFASCIALCFVFSLIFMRNNWKKFCITIALGLEVAYVFFAMVRPDILTDPNLLLYLPLGLACGVQFFFFAYTLSLDKGKGLKIFDIALRVAICLLVWFLLPKATLPNDLKLSTYQLIDIMRLANMAITLLSLLFHAKTEWISLLGFLILFGADVWFWLMTTGPMLFEVAAGILADMLKYYAQYVIYFPIVGFFLMALSSVWAKKKKKE